MLRISKYLLYLPVMRYQRRQNVKHDAAARSLFLFGPRQTGKTSLLRNQFPNALYFNLLQADTFLRLSGNPGLLRERINAHPRVQGEPVIIDEIQKLPILLDEVHDLIESDQRTFILTGNSPRKLKAGNINLLGGRARVRRLFPLVSAEIDDFDLSRALNFGTIPSIYLSEDPEEDLLAYAGVYLQEEIQAEGAVRRIESFSRFLRSAAAMNGGELNFEKVSRALSLPSRTVREYFYILSDTLVGRLLEPFRKTVRRKPVSRSKFYFFDIGVANVLSGRFRIEAGSDAFGPAFEHFILNEIIAWLSYSRDRREVTFWRDQAGHEVDFVIGDEYAVEVKGASHVQKGDMRGLLLLAEEAPMKQKIIVSMEPEPRLSSNGIRILPWKLFLDELWDNAYC